MGIDIFLIVLTYKLVTIQGNFDITTCTRDWLVIWYV